MTLVVYGDFNCPYSCLASARADELVGRGVAQIDWRAVEHDQAIPTPSETVEGDLAAMLDREVAEVRGLVGHGEVFPIRRPPVRSNTAGAVAAFAAAPEGEADGLRRRLFAALWFDGRDIGDQAVVSELGGNVGADTGDRVSAWQAAWSGHERRVVPMLVHPDGYVSRGLGALARLAELVIPDDGPVG
jgi:predicted DsbA family dithiol-disulfide isomerase